jgi:hypothetical protein
MSRWADGCSPPPLRRIPAGMGSNKPLSQSSLPVLAYSVTPKPAPCTFPPSFLPFVPPASEGFVRIVTLQDRARQSKGIHSSIGITAVTVRVARVCAAPFPAGGQRPPAWPYHSASFASRDLRPTVSFDRPNSPPGEAARRYPPACRVSPNPPALPPGRASRTFACRSKRLESRRMPRLEMKRGSFLRFQEQAWLAMQVRRSRVARPHSRSTRPRPSGST